MSRFIGRDRDLSGLKERGSEQKRRTGLSKLKPLPLSGPYCFSSWPIRFMFLLSIDHFPLPQSALSSRSQSNTVTISNLDSWILIPGREIQFGPA